MVKVTRRRFGYNDGHVRKRAPPGAAAHGREHQQRGDGKKGLEALGHDLENNTRMTWRRQRAGRWILVDRTRSLTYSENCFAATP